MTQPINTINWFAKALFDDPRLNSPQPCAHGSGCDYKALDIESGQMVPACCRFVHPGEEGNGRRLFPAREQTGPDGKVQRQSACVRLTGRAGFYERRRLGLSWKAWCEKEGIAYTANTPGEEPPRLVIARIGGPASDSEQAEVLTIVKRDGRTLVVPRDVRQRAAPSRGGGGGGAPRALFRVRIHGGGQHRAPTACGLVAAHLEAVKAVVEAEKSAPHSPLGGNGTQEQGSPTPSDSDSS
jgi:hypothetical protein